MFLPTTKKELNQLGWSVPDIILVTGDSYIDSPYIGVALIGHWLVEQGFKVAVVAQPDVNSPDDITRLGEPSLFWGVSGGCMDSMVANWTASGKKRNQDDFTPGGVNDKRPDRAVIAYSNLIRRFFKNTKPIVLGGIEASLRRVAHFDFKSGKIRRSILFDAKADYLLYGMAEISVVQLAQTLRSGGDPSLIDGLCYIANEPPDNALELPSFESCLSDRSQFFDFSLKFFNNTEPGTASRMIQQHDKRYLIHNPPSQYLSTEELDKIYELDFERDLHPYYGQFGKVRALDTIRFSITTHRGCYGQCSFCAISIHQGRVVRSRSESSIIREVESFTKHNLFRGIINDVGGATANMYATTCPVMENGKTCGSKKCLFPNVCDNLQQGHEKQIALLKRIKKVPLVKKVFVASGIRYDMILKDSEFGYEYLKFIMRNECVSGQMKIAPEHTNNNILEFMSKPNVETLCDFKNLFDKINLSMEKKIYLTYYLIAAHPGCSKQDMINMRKFLISKLGHLPEQIQIFTPTPSTLSTLAYYSEINPFSQKKCFVEKNKNNRELQKKIIAGKKNNTFNFSTKKNTSFKKK